jgi:hypothetical protein
VPAKAPGDMSAALKMCCQELRGLLALLDRNGCQTRLRAVE